MEKTNGTLIPIIDQFAISNVKRNRTWNRRKFHSKCHKPEPNLSQGLYLILQAYKFACKGARKNISNKKPLNPIK